MLSMHKMSTEDVESPGLARNKERILLFVINVISKKAQCLVNFLSKMTIGEQLK